MSNLYNDGDETEDSEDEFFYKDKPHIYSQPSNTISFKDKTHFYILIDSIDRNVYSENLFKFKINFSISPSSYDKSIVNSNNEKEQLFLQMNQIQNRIQQLSSQNNDLLTNQINKLIEQKDNLNKIISTINNKEYLYNGQNNFCHTQKRYTDIENIICEKIWIPKYNLLNKIKYNNTEIQTNSQRLLYLNIKELNTNLDGSNNDIYTSYQSFIPSEVSQFDNLLYKPLNEPPKNVIPINLSYMTIDLTFPYLTETYSDPDKYFISGMTINTSTIETNSCVIEFYLKKIVPFYTIELGHIIKFYDLKFNNKSLTELENLLKSKCIVIELITLDSGISGFKIKLTNIENVNMLYEYFAMPYIFSSEVFCMNLNYQYQLLFKLTKTVPLLEIDRYPTSK